MMQADIKQHVWVSVVFAVEEGHDVVASFCLGAHQGADHGMQREAADRDVESHREVLSCARNHLLQPCSQRVQSYLPSSKLIPFDRPTRGLSHSHRNRQTARTCMPCG